MTTADGGQPELWAFQLEMARLFFALPASKGFLLAGGAALLAQHLTARPTEERFFRPVVWIIYPYLSVRSNWNGG